MINTTNSPCIRCGTQRVVSKVWEEKIDDSVIINTEMVCPDPECQKKVDITNKNRLDKYAAIKLRSEQRVENRKADQKARKAKKSPNS
ncbi:hypothetical protein COY16_03955 [Candidatus Roizmanbacteria bacterium CG_4_10_14_0_2_um_filter_39_13]|uniref:Uncharacterized protein n=1 Tax=Candidatus Roizmanbacteria bacterium CG_4_10_14_0_2_um_filter_39_13 TaxID=1974825 RepID=A0A2M7TXP4_9BACT|nr:MAG: hypothetical protein COY16_03955 [Candidatus Roizmanbacteria bacterium CG_4_10_14_0_2_um_filter_39_13]